MHKQRLPNSNKQSGFTLVELLVVLAVSAIILSIAAPSFANIVANNRVTAAANDLVIALNLGKSEAVRSGNPTVLCQSSNGTSCGGDQTAWANGWVLFNDADGDDTLDAGERLIRVHSALNPQLAFRLNEGDNSSFITFSPAGRANRNGSFCFENSYNASKSKMIVITQVGRFRTETWDSSGNCSAS